MCQGGTESPLDQVRYLVLVLGPGTMYHNLMGTCLTDCCLREIPVDHTCHASDKNHGNLGFGPIFHGFLAKISKSKDNSQGNGLFAKNTVVSR